MPGGQFVSWLFVLYATLAQDATKQTAAALSVMCPSYPRKADTLYARTILSILLSSADVVVACAGPVLSDQTRCSLISIGFSVSFFNG